MADYINKHILAQAYVRLDLDFEETSSEIDLVAIEKSLQLFFQQRARHFIDEKIEVSVEFKEGSFKTLITVVGALYIAIGNYGDFRQGVQVLYDDAKWLAESGARESIFQLGVRSNCVLRKEARVGIVGKLKRALDEVDLVVGEDGKASQREQAARLERISEEVSRIFELLTNPNDRDCVRNGLKDAVAGVPMSPKTPERREANETAVLNYRRYRKDIVATLA